MGFQEARQSGFSEMHNTGKIGISAYFDLFAISSLFTAYNASKYEIIFRLYFNVTYFSGLVHFQWHS